MKIRKSSRVLTILIVFTTSSLSGVSYANGPVPVVVMDGGSGTPGDLNITDLTDVGSKLYFTSGRGGELTQLWASDGTASGTNQLSKFELTAATPSEDIEIQGPLIPIGSNVYFRRVSGYQAINQDSLEFWRSDGTIAGTKKIDETNISGLNLSHLGTSGSKIYFAGHGGSNNPSNFSLYLYAFGGPTEQTPLLLNLEAEQLQGVSIDNFSPDGPGAYFTTYTKLANGNYALWHTDGTPAGTKKIYSFDDRIDPLYRSFLVSNGKLFFSADDGIHGLEPWVSGSLPGSTHVLKNISDTGSSNADNFVTFKGKTFFVATDDIHGTSIWRTNGTEKGTVFFKQIPARSFFVFGSKLLFISGTANGDQWWASDGTSKGTAPFTNFTSQSRYFPLLKDIKVMGDKFYFGDLNGLWSSNGKSMNLVTATQVNELTKFGKSLLVFRGYSEKFGQEPWISDGTSKGTRMLANLNLNGDSNPQEFTQVGSMLFFTAEDGKFDNHAHKLWMIR